MHRRFSSVPINLSDFVIVFSWFHSDCAAIFPEIPISSQLLKETVSLPSRFVLLFAPWLAREKCVAVAIEDKRA